MVWPRAHTQHSITIGWDTTQRGHGVTHNMGWPWGGSQHGIAVGLDTTERSMALRWTWHRGVSSLLLPSPGLGILPRPPALPSLVTSPCLLLWVFPEGWEAEGVGVRPTPTHHAGCLYCLRDGAGVGLTPEG